MGTLFTAGATQPVDKPMVLQGFLEGSNVDLGKEILAKSNLNVTAADDVESVANRLQASGIITNAKLFTQYVEKKGGLELHPGAFK